MLTITSCRSECCVPSGHDFEAAGDSVVRYFVCNYLLRGLRVAVNMTLGALSWLNAETVERAPTPLFGKLVRCSAMGLFFRETTVLSLRITVRVFTNLSFQHSVPLTQRANTLAIDREIFSGSVDAGFVLSLPFHHGDLEPDCVEVSARGAYAQGKNYVCNTLR